MEEELRPRRVFTSMNRKVVFFFLLVCLPSSGSIRDLLRSLAYPVGEHLCRWPYHGHRGWKDANCNCNCFELCNGSS